MKKLLILIFLCGFTAAGIKTVFGSNLIDIRTGAHAKYSRLVVHFDSEVNCRVIRDKNDRNLTLECRPVTYVKNFGPIEIAADDPFIRNIRYVWSANVLSVVVTLKKSDVRLRRYVMRSPYRLVVDIRNGNGVAATPAVGKESEKPALLTQAKQAPNKMDGNATAPDSKNPESSHHGLNTTAKKADSKAITPDRKESKSRGVQPASKKTGSSNTVPDGENPRSKNRDVNPTSKKMGSEATTADRKESKNRGVRPASGQAGSEITAQDRNNAESKNRAVKPVAGGEWSPDSAVTQAFTLLKNKRNPDVQKSATDKTKPFPGFEFKDKITPMLLTALGAGLVLILSMTMLLSRRKHKSKPKRVKAQKRRAIAPDKRKTVRKRRQPPAPDEAPVTAGEFIEALNSALSIPGKKTAKTQAPKTGSRAALNSELQTIEKVVKVDHMIASLSEALRSPAVRGLYIPDLTDVIRELELKHSPEQITEEITKNVLIGKDGVDFVNNLRKRMLN